MTYRIKIKNFLKESRLVVFYLFRHPGKFWNALNINLPSLPSLPAGKAGRGLGEVKKLFRWCFATLPRRIASSILIALLLIGPISFLFTGNKAEAAWWNDSWQYRKSIAVTNNTTAQSNVYISLTLNTSDTTKFQADCGDLRFTNLSGDLLQYYIVSGCGTSSTVVHTLMDVFPAGAQTIYYYYGNPTADNGFSATDFTTVASNYTVGALGAEEKGTGPVAYWSFDEGQGTTAQDSTGNNYDGTLTNMSATSSPTSGWQTEDNCVAGKCLAFDGNDDYVNVADSSNFSFAGDFTISVWVNPQVVNGTWEGITGTYNGDGWMIVSSYDTTGNIGWWDAGSGWINTGVPLELNRWQHIVVTRSGTTRKIYLDNREISSLSSSQSINGGDLSIGRWYPGYAYFNGSIDEPKIYNYARSATQIKMDYNAGLAGSGGVEGAAVSLGGKSQKWLTDGLVGHWKMDEASWSGTAGEVKDASGNNNGTAVNGATTAAGKFGQGGSFDGSNDYVETSDIALAENTDKLTVSAWIYSNPSANYRAVINKGYYTSGSWEFRMTRDSEGPNLSFSVVTSNGRVGSTIAGFQNSAWYHVVGVYDGSKTYVYQDGILIDSDAQTGNIVDTANTVKIGQNGNAGEYWNGKIDETRIYNRSLSPKEVSDLYAYGPGPVGYWNMEEGGGTTANDTSGNSNTGTLTNGPTWVSGKYGKAVNFDGSNDYIATSLDLGINMGSGNWTTSAWVTGVNTWSDEGIFYGTGNSSANNRCLLRHRGNGMLSIVNDDTGNAEVNTSSWVLQNNVWQYVTAQRDGNDLKIYVDGILKATGTGKAFTLAGNLTMGRAGSLASVYWNRKIDDVKIYNYARTSDQIKEDMLGRAGSSVSDKSTLGYWKFDEGYSTAANNSGSGGSTLNGTIYNSTWSQSGRFGKAVTLDGTNGQAIISNSSSLRNNGNDVTLSIWVNPDASDDGGYVISKPWNGSGIYNYYITSSGGATPSYSFYLNGASGWSLASNKSVTAGTWNHLVVSVSGTTKAVNFYVNGVLTNSGTHTITNWTPSIGDSNLNLVLGCIYPYGGSCNAVSSALKSTLDEFKYYNYVLTADEIKLDYNQGKSIALGSSGTTATGAPSNAADRAYCPPGDTTVTCAPTAEWKFDEGSGTTANNSAGSGNFGTLTSGPTWVTGKIGKAVNFSGGSTAVTLNSTINLYDTNNWTVSAWVKTSANGSVLSNNSGGPVANDLCIAGSKIAYNHYVGPWTTEYGTSTITDGNWHYLTWINYSNRTMDMYVDGKKEASAVSSAQSSGPVNSIGRNWSASFNGSIDNVVYYNYARTPAQIAWDYNRGAPVGWWKMDEGEGLTVHDSSGTNASGTLAAANWTAGVTGTASRVDSSYLSLPVSAKAPLTTTFWFKPTTNTDSISAGNNAPLFYWYQDGSNYIHYSLYSYGGSPPGVPYLQPRGYVTHYYHQAYNYLANQWYFAVFKMETNQMWLDIYKDGALVNSITEDVNAGYASYNFSALRLYDFGSECNYDDVRVYRYILSADQLEQVRNGGAVNFR